MRRTVSGRGMGGLLEARPEKSTQEFAPRGVAMRKRRMARLIPHSSDNAMVSLCRNKISDPGWPPNSRAARTAQSWGISQPPPEGRPAPSEARHAGRRAPRGCFEARRKAARNATAHVDDPGFPDTRAIGG